MIYLFIANIYLVIGAGFAIWDDMHERRSNRFLFRLIWFTVVSTFWPGFAVLEIIDWIARDK